MQKIKSAFELGQVSRKPDLCNQVFECATRDFDIAMPDVSRTKRVDCSGLGQVCPGVRKLIINLLIIKLIIYHSSCQLVVLCVECSSPEPVLPSVPWLVCSVEDQDTSAPSPPPPTPLPKVSLKLLRKLWRR